jgi:hypothetical protein
MLGMYQDRGPKMAAKLSERGATLSFVTALDLSQATRISAPKIMTLEESFPKRELTDGEVAAAWAQYPGLSFADFFCDQAEA